MYVLSEVYVEGVFVSVSSSQDVCCTEDFNLGRARSQSLH